MALSVTLDRRSRRNLLRLTAALDPQTLFGLLEDFFRREAQILAGQIVKTQLSGDPVMRRTGSLARSIAGIAIRQGGVPGLRVGVFRGPALAYAGVLEKGTVGKGGEFPTIRPKKAKALAFPPEGSKALTPAGVDRFGGPRSFPGELNFIPFRGSGVAIGGLYDEKDLKPRGDGEVNLDNVVPVYLLVKKVDIEPRRYLEKGLEAYLPTLVRKLGEFLGNTLRGLQRA